MAATHADAPPSPFWGTFALLREGLERLVALNLVWVLLLVPGAVGLAFPALPLLARTLLIGVSAVLIVPGSATLYVVLRGAQEGSEVTLPESWRAFRLAALPSFRTLALLYLLLGLIAWANLSAALPLGFLLVLRLLLLFTLSSSLYWGPLWAEAPNRSSARLLSESFDLVFRYPARTLWTGLVSLLLLVAGTISIGGLVLVVAVLLAGYQTLVVHSLKG